MALLVALLSSCKTEIGSGGIGSRPDWPIGDDVIYYDEFRQGREEHTKRLMNETKSDGPSESPIVGLSRRLEEFAA